jgi:tRNA1(Val) A37 N6-methylase TrmN6
MPGARVVGIDANPALVRLAKANARRNGVGARVAFLTATVGGRWPKGVDEGAADHVMANPPYLEPTRATRKGSATRRAAMVESAGAGVETWIDWGLRLLRPGGTITIVQRADRLDHLLAALSKRTGGIVVYPLWPGPGDRPAKRVLVAARKGSRAPLTLTPGLVLHEAGGRYTDAAESVLRRGEALVLCP